jgi:hypothetical protein
MSRDEVKRQFVEQLRLRARDDKYIDENEEREILQFGIQQGEPEDSARAELARVCEANGYLLESKAIALVKSVVETFAGHDGKIDERTFRDAVTVCKRETQGRKNDLQCKRMVIEIIEDNSYPVKESLFNHWYRHVRKEVGMT